MPRKMPHAPKKPIAVDRNLSASRPGDRTASQSLRPSAKGQVIRARELHIHLPPGYRVVGYGDRLLIQRDPEAKPGRARRD